MMNKYEIIIYWNAEDEIFVAEIPELKGCITHSNTHNEALKEVNEASMEWIKIAKGWQYRSQRKD